MNALVPEDANSCPVCREVLARSTLYERWLVAENFGDTATLQAAATARGFCSAHARRMLEADPEIAGPIARFVLHALSATLADQRHDRRGYRDALEPQALCPWCASEREALEYAMNGEKRRGAALCPPHERAATVLERHRTLDTEPPFRPGQGLDPPGAPNAQLPAAYWWSPAIDILWKELRSSCCACSAARAASRQREAFLRSGPQANEHWDVPTLCIAHYVALGAPDEPAYRRTPDAIPRTCDWCLAMEHAAERAEELFAIAYRDANFRLAYAAVPGLCIPHAANVAHRIDSRARGDLLTAISVRVDGMEWELEETARRRSWQMRDQGAFPGSADVSHRAWWLIAGGMKRGTRRDGMHRRE